MTRDHGIEIPALRALRSSGAKAAISNAAFPAPLSPSVATLSIVYETDFFDQSPWHWFDPQMIQRMATYTTRSIRNAAATFAISKHTATRLVRDFGVLPERSLVACPAVDIAVSHVPPRMVSRPYVAQVGWFHPRKDMQLVLAAWVAARDRGLEQDLVLIGRPGPADVVLGPLARQILEGAGRHVDHVHMKGHVSRDEYVSLLAHADALVAGSRQEGFCIPVVEAFALGTPVVAADRTALSEVAGAVGTLADATAEAMADALVRTLEQPVDQSVLRDYARTFTVEAQVRPYLEVLDALEEDRWPPRTDAARSPVAG